MPARKMPSAEELRRLYWDEQMGPGEIAERFGASIHTIRTRMHRDGIPMRSRAEGSRLSVAKGQRRKRPVNTPLKDRVRCAGCGWAWMRTAEAVSAPCPHCGKATSQRTRKFRPSEVSKLRTYRREHAKTGMSGTARLRRTVLLLVGRGDVSCVRCGCDRPELLEINHKNGDGRKDIRGPGAASHFYWAIAKLERPVDDLELCCKVCNALHYLELKHGPLPFTVTYERDSGGGTP